MSKVYRLFVPGITCGTCVNTILSALAQKKFSYLKKFFVDIFTQELIFECHDNEEHMQEIQATIEEVGFYTRKPLSTKQHIIFGITGSAIGLTLMLLMALQVMFSFIFMVSLACFSSILTLYLGKDIFIYAWKRLIFAKTINMDVLFSFSVLIALMTSIIGLIFPSLLLPCLFDAAFMILGFRHIGKAIEIINKQKINHETSFQSRAPLNILKRRDNNHWYQIDIDALIKDDMIKLGRGEIVPVDGIAQSKLTYVNTALIDGQIVNTPFNFGDTLLAGMKVESDELIVKVTHPVINSNLARLDAAILAARMHKSDFEKIGDRILNYFIPILIICAIVVGVLVGFCMTPIFGFQTALYILVAACPCTLGFIVPLLIKVALSKAATKNILFKNGAAIEIAGQINTVVFDLNGTLTEGKPVIQKIFYDNKVFKNEGEFKQVLYALEEDNSHLIAQVICKYTQKPEEKLEIMNKKNLGNGVSALINNQRYIIANDKYLQDHKIDFADVSQWCEYSLHRVFLLKEMQIVGCMGFADQLRDDAKSTIEFLRKQGKAIKICTGASRHTAEYYGKLLNISAEDIYAECVGFDEKNSSITKKQAVLQNLKNKIPNCKNAMIGDAGNDAAAILESDLGIAIGSAFADIASSNNALAEIKCLTAMQHLFEVAKNAVKYMRQNLFLSLLYNTVAVLIAPILCISFCIMLNPGIAAALMIVQSILILANTYRFYAGDINNRDHAFVSPEITLATNGDQNDRVNSLTAPVKISSPPNFLLVNITGSGNVTSSVPSSSPKGVKPSFSS